MDLVTHLLKKHSKANTLQIVDYIGDDEVRFAELMAIFFQNDYRLNQRSAWAVSKCADVHPELIMPYLEPILEKLKMPVHDAVRRNAFRVLAKLDIPDELLGLAAEVGFDSLMDPKVAVAIRAHAMAVLFNIVQKVPELGEELRLVLEEQLSYPTATAGLRSRGGKILRALKNGKNRW